MKMPTSIGRKTIGNTIRTLVYFAFTIVWKRCYLRTFIWTFHFACNTFEIHAHQKTFQFPLESTTFSSCISISKWDNFAYYFIGTKMFSLSFQKHIQVRIVQNQDEPNQSHDFKGLHFAQNCLPKTIWFNWNWKNEFSLL